MVELIIVPKGRTRSTSTSELVVVRTSKKKSRTLPTRNKSRLRASSGIRRVDQGDSFVFPGVLQQVTPLSFTLN